MTFDREGAQSEDQGESEEAWTEHEHMTFFRASMHATEVAGIGGVIDREAPSEVQQAEGTHHSWTICPTSTIKRPA